MTCALLEDEIKRLKAGMDRTWAKGPCPTYIGFMDYAGQANELMDCKKAMNRELKQMREGKK